MEHFISDALEWFKAHWAQALPILSLTVATVGVLLTHHARIRAGIKRSLIRLGGRLGFTRSRYKAAFLKSHRELRNIYLNRIEQLDLVATYVPLHVINAVSGRSDQPAIEVLLDPEETRTLILGDPGSGKTTLLKSFGVGLVSRDVYHKTQGMKVNRDLIPIYVELRDFAARLAKYPTLASYVTEYVLSKHLDGVGGEVFFRQLLAQRQCVLLLDALDEVGLEDYDAVRVAVLTFLGDTSANLPTAAARVIMTSRAQNFLPLIDDWIPAGFQRYNVLAPFSDDDIRRFLTNRSSDLPAGKTPAALWEEIRSSGTLELHRTPLILTLSLGLYIHIPRYTIPESIATFYAEIVQELLQRHDFRTRFHLTKRNTFPAEYKLLFLRDFALKMAMRPGRFDEFTFRELKESFDTFQLKVPKLSGDDRAAFLAEITDNAGLLRRVSDDDVYVFAHRSFHEYFAAIQLSKAPEVGTKELIKRANDPLWRQVTLFFAAMDHDQQDSLLQGLMAENPELAGYCLAITTGASPSISLSIVGRLDATASRGNAVSTLGALSAIARNSNAEVRAKSLKTIERIVTEVLGNEDAAALWGLTEDDLVRLAQSLSTTGSRNVVSCCIALSRLVKDESQFVGPLWTCLSYLGDDANSPEAYELVVRLLELAQKREGFDALQARPSMCPPFATPALLDFVFPFKQTRDRNANLVTLLAWADFLNVVPETCNGFLRAFKLRRLDLEGWLNIERELAKKPITFSLYRPGRLLFWGGYAACLVVLTMSYYGFGWADFIRHHSLPFAPWWAGLLFVFAIGLANGVLVGMMQPSLEATPLSMRSLYDYPNRFLEADEDRAANPLMLFLDRDFPTLWRLHSGRYYWDYDTAVALIICALFQMPLVLTGVGLFWDGEATLRGVVVGTLSGMLLPLVIFWLPAAKLFFQNNKIDLRRRSRLASLMLDDSSRVWVNVR